jgi:ABC-type polysaccharide/polyol phosphate transport system ATPase subunit
MQKQGVTILFVAHDFERVQNLCTRAIWLENGTVQAYGDVAEIVEAMKEKYYWDGQQVIEKTEEAIDAQASLTLAHHDG